MSSVFALWRGKPTAFPETVSVGGKDVAVNADFRVALKMLKLYGDPGVGGFWKNKLMVGWFYPEWPGDVAGALEALLGFMSPPDADDADPIKKYARERKGIKKAEGPAESPTFCFEFDAKEIFSSFMQCYGIDLVETPFMHWHKFLMLFQALGRDCPLGRKMEIRTMDIKDFKARDRAKMMKIKKEAQIPVKLTGEELRMTEELMAKLL